MRRLAAVAALLTITACNDPKPAAPDNRAAAIAAAERRAVADTDAAMAEARNAAATAPQRSETTGTNEGDDLFPR